MMKKIILSFVILFTTTCLLIAQQDFFTLTGKTNNIPDNYLLNPEGKIIAKDLRGEALEEKLAAISGHSTILEKKDKFSKTNSQGIDFKPISIRDGLKLAKSENKNLFILFGTTHCGYSRHSYVELSNDKSCGDFINKNFISIGYGDSTVINGKEWYNSKTRLQLNLIENELETVFCNYFVFPNYFFFNKKGEIVYINAAPKKSQKILKYAESTNNGKLKTPFLFGIKFNNKMYPKNKSTYKMLSHCLNAYVLMDVPHDIDYKNDSIYSLNDFKFAKKNLRKAKAEIELSIQNHEYYFNCFLAAMIYYQLNKLEKAKIYAKKGLNNYPKHWTDSRKLTDKLMKEILR